MRRWPFNILVIVAVGMVIYGFFHSGPRQFYNMRKAAHHITVLRPQIENNPRFKEVSLRPYTGNDGCLGVFGWVDSDEDEAALRKLIADSHPPVEVFFGLVFRKTVEASSTADSLRK